LKDLVNGQLIEQDEDET